MTAKDRERVAALVEFTKKNGLTAGVQKAKDDAGKITQYKKCEARAELLFTDKYAALGSVYQMRAAWLKLLPSTKDTDVLENNS